MSTEVVDRTDATGQPRPDTRRCAPSSAWCRCWAGWRCRPASSRSPACRDCSPKSCRARTCSCWALIIPAISVTGVFLRGTETVELRPIDWRILGGGIAFGAVVVALGLGGVPYAQEIIFVISMAVVCTMLVLVTRDLDHDSKVAIFFTTVIIFAFRATPTGRRRLLLVDAGRAQLRRRVLRRAAADRRGAVDPGDVDVQQADHRIFRDQGVVLDRDLEHAPVAAQHRPGLRPAPLDAGDVRLRRAHHRPRRRRGGLALHSAQHDPAAHADRVLRAAPAIARPGSR